MPSTKHPWRYRTTLFQERSKQRSEDVPVLVSKESDLDGDMEHPVFQTSGYEPAVPDPLAVLFGGHNYRCRISVRCISYRVDVGTCEVVVIREVEMLHDLIVAAQIVAERSVVGDS